MKIPTLKQATIPPELFKRQFIGISSLIKMIEYSYLPHGKVKICERMLVTFVNGSQIEYMQPPPEPMQPTYDLEKTYSQFIAAESIGKFWHKHIKDILPGKKIK